MTKASALNVDVALNLELARKGINIASDYIIRNKSNESFDISKLCKVVYERNKDIKVSFKTKNLSFTITAEYDWALVPEKANELFSNLNKYVFINFIKQISISNFKLESSNLSLSISELSLEDKENKYVVEAIVDLLNECLAQKIADKYILLTGKFCLACWLGTTYFAKSRYDTIYDENGIIQNDPDTVEYLERQFDNNNDDIRIYDGFVILSCFKGFHIEAKALYNEDDWEEVRNMW